MGSKANPNLPLASGEKEKHRQKKRKRRGERRIQGNVQMHSWEFSPGVREALCQQRGRAEEWSSVSRE